MDSPKFYSEINKHETPSNVRHTCGPGSEISFAPFANNSLISAQTSQKDLTAHLNNENSPNSNSNFTNVGIRPQSMLSTGSSVKKLILSGELFDKNSIVIGPNGYDRGLRKKKDGHFYLGFADYKDSNGNVANDYVLPHSRALDEDNYN